MFTSTSGEPAIAAGPAKASVKVNPTHNRNFRIIFPLLRFPPQPTGFSLALGRTTINARSKRASSIAALFFHGIDRNAFAIGMLLAVIAPDAEGKEGQVEESEKGQHLPGEGNEQGDGECRDAKDRQYQLAVDALADRLAGIGRNATDHHDGNGGS